MDETVRLELRSQNGIFSFKGESRLIYTFAHFHLLEGTRIKYD